MALRELQEADLKKWSNPGQLIDKATPMTASHVGEVGGKLKLDAKVTESKKLRVVLSNHSREAVILIDGWIKVDTPSTLTERLLRRSQEKRSHSFVNFGQQLLLHPSYKDEDGDRQCNEFSHEFSDLSDNYTLSFDITLSTLEINRKKADVGDKISEIGARSLIQDMASAKKNTETADVQIICGGKTFNAHRFVLSARSSVFAAMFSHKETKESETGIVELSDCEADTMEWFVTYLYEGILPQESFQVAEKLIHVATKYQVQSLIDACQIILSAKLEVDNAIRVAILGDLYNIQELKLEALATIKAAKKPLKSMVGWKDLDEFQDLKIEIVDNKAD